MFANVFNRTFSKQKNLLGPFFIHGRQCPWVAKFSLVCLVVISVEASSGCLMNIYGCIYVCLNSLAKANHEVSNSGPPQTMMIRYVSFKIHSLCFSVLMTHKIELQRLVRGKRKIANDNEN